MNALGVLLSAAGLAGYLGVRLLHRKERLPAYTETLLSIACIAMEATGLLLLIF